MAQLLDQYGNPVKRAELKKEVARAGLTGIRQFWSPDIAAGITPYKLAAVLRAADENEGYDYLALAEQLEERDPHYASVLGTRKRSVSGAEPIVHAASDDAKDQKIAEAIKEHIAEHDGFSALIEDLLDGLGKGYSVVETIWDGGANSWWPQCFKHRDPKFFRFDRETATELRLLTDDAPVDGVALDGYHFLAHTPRLKTGIPLRGGLARLIAFTWICKAYTVKDWVAFVELFGLPLRLGRYDGSASKQDIETLFRAVANIGSDAAAVLPKAMEIEFQEAAKGTGAEVFESLARWADEQISKAVLGQTMTSDDGSSMAQAAVHNDVRLDIRESDAKQVMGTIQRHLVRPFVDLNFGVQDKYPRITLAIEEAEDVEKTVQAVVELAGIGVTFKADELRNKVGMSTPEEGDEIVGGVAKPETDQDRKPVGTATNRANLTGADPYGETDRIEAEALDEWVEITAPITDPIERLLADASSYEEAIARLPDLIPDMDASELIGSLVKSAFKARVIGEERDADG